MKKFFAFVKTLFDGTAKRKAVDLGLCNFGGQGRDKYGK